MHIDEDKVTFDGYGQGVRGLNQYGFNVEFYLPIDAEVGQSNITLL